MPVKPKDASTLMILRPCPDPTQGPIEVLMVLRHPQCKFAPSAYVFPGGIMDAGDRSDFFEMHCRNLNRKEAGRIIPDMPDAERSLAVWISAIRECFEEVGLLPAYGPDGSVLSMRNPDVIARFEQYRQKLYNKSITLEDILKIENITLATDRIFYYSHWITPEPAPMRYDVRFFVTSVPENQMPCHDDCELVDCVWITPQEALRANAENRFRMLLPTSATMRELSLFTSVEDVLHSTQQKNIPAILTRLEEQNNDFIEVLPDGTYFGPCPVKMK